MTVLPIKVSTISGLQSSEVISLFEAFHITVDRADLPALYDGLVSGFHYKRVDFVLINVISLAIVLPTREFLIYIKGDLNGQGNTII